MARSTAMVRFERKDAGPVHQDGNAGTSSPGKGERIVLSLVLAAIFFTGLHLGLAGTTLRDRAVAALGQAGYQGVFSLASVIGLVWLVMAYNRAPYAATW